MCFAIPMGEGSLWRKSTALEKSTPALLIFAIQANLQLEGEEIFLRFKVNHVFVS